MGVLSLFTRRQLPPAAEQRDIFDNNSRIPTWAEISGQARLHARPRHPRNGCWAARRRPGDHDGAETIASLPCKIYEGFDAQKA
jgi:hypothetical protein